MRAAEVTSRTVLITGCSSGIGYASAHHLRDRGWRVIPTARSGDDLARLEGEGFTSVAIDLADPESVERAAQRALELVDGSLGGLVNNAGYAQFGAVEDVSREDLRRQFEVNVFGMHQLTRFVVPHFRNQGWGRVVNISSVYGVVAGPLVGSYCASKFAMEALSDALRIELRGSGVAVSIVEPGPILTAFRDNALEQVERSLDLEQAHFGAGYARMIKRRKGRRKRQDFVNRPPEDVAVRIAHALESRRPRIRYPVTPPAHLAALAKRVLPAALIDRLLALQLER